MAGAAAAAEAAAAVVAAAAAMSCCLATLVVVAASVVVGLGKAATKVQEAWKPGPLQQLPVRAVEAVFEAVAPEPASLKAAPVGGWPDTVGLAGCWPANFLSAVAKPAAATRAWPDTIHLVGSGEARPSPAKGASARLAPEPMVEAGPAPVQSAHLCKAGLPGGSNAGRWRPHGRLVLCCNLELRGR